MVYPPAVLPTVTRPSTNHGRRRYVTFGRRRLGATVWTPGRLGAERFGAVLL